MKVFIISIIMSLFFSACTTSSLLVSLESQLEMEYESKKFLIAQEVFKARIQRYNNIEIFQYKLKKDTSILFYEYVEADINWEFIYGPIMTLGYIFNTSRSHILYKDSAISFVQLKISKDKHINILVESSSFSDMGFVYGFSDKEFIHLLEEVQGIKNKKALMQSKAVLLQETSSYLSVWSVRMLFFQPLLQLSMRQSLS